MKTIKEYNSFSELSADLYSNEKKDSGKENEHEIRLKAREKFIKENKLYCPVCKSPMHYVMGTNICTCSNEKCKGIKHTKKTKDGSMVTSYSTVYRTLTPSKAKYAARIFRDGE